MRGGFITLSEQSGAGPGLELDIPGKIGPESYLTSVMITLSKIDESILDLKGSTDRRPYYLTRQLIARIPDDEIRRKLFDLLEDEISRMREEISNNDEYGKAILELVSVISGECIAYFDEYIGIARKQVISKV